MEEAYREGHGAGSMQQALDTFFIEARRHRATSTAGQSMPPALFEAWSMLLDAADRFLASGQALTELSRVRLLLQTEFQGDAALYGDMPSGLAERATQAIRSLNAAIVIVRSASGMIDPRQFLWPVSPLIISSPFGDRVHPILGQSRFHAGIDLEAPLLHPVRAAADGQVVFADWNGAHGRQIELTHDAHWTTRYSHLQRLLVAPGMKVRRGEVIALSGQSGLSTGPHLHFELRRDGDALDPEVLMPAMPLLSARP